MTDFSHTNKTWTNQKNNKKQTKQNQALKREV